MAEAEAAAVLKVFILITEHHNGRNVYPCSSYERAWARLDQYVQEFWNSSGGHIPPDSADPWRSEDHTAGTADRDVLRPLAVQAGGVVGDRGIRGAVIVELLNFHLLCELGTDYRRSSGWGEPIAATSSATPLRSGETSPTLSPSRDRRSDVSRVFRNPENSRRWGR